MKRVEDVAQLGDVVKQARLSVRLPGLLAGQNVLLDDGRAPRHAAQMRGGDVTDHRGEVAGRQRNAELRKRSGDDDGVAADRTDRRRRVLGDGVASR